MHYFLVEFNTGSKWVPSVTFDGHNTTPALFLHSAAAKDYIRNQAAVRDLNAPAPNYRISKVMMIRSKYDTK